MKKIAVLGAALLAVSLLVQASGASSRGDRILEFDTMVGVAPPFTGALNERLGVRGAGAPWRIDRGRGELRGDGELEIDVEGLVLSSGPLAGTNPVAFFRGVVSCLSISNGLPTTVNVFTAPFPATRPGGDAKIEADLSLPSPCLGPIVFVTSGGGDPPGNWFAVTGL